MNEQPALDVTPRVRVLQIIVLALALGVACFMAVVIALREDRQPPQTPMISYLAVFFTVASVSAFFVVPRLILSSTRRRVTPDRRLAAFQDVKPEDIHATLLQAYQTSLIIGAALLEGPAFFLLIAYLLEGQAMCLILAVLLLAGIAAQFPTRAGVSRWLLEQERLAAEGD